VVRPYGEKGLVQIADTCEEFVAAIEAALADDHAERLHEIDAYLSQTSWDRTWKRMTELIEDVVMARSNSLIPQAQPAIVKSATAAVAVGARVATASGFVSGD
jgi:hypothetical protein